MSVMFSAASKSQIADLAAAKAEMSSRYLTAGGGMPLAAFGFRATALSASENSNIVGVGIDEKHVDGIPTGIQAVKFLVKSKVAPASLSKAQTIPKEVNGIPTDVEEVGNIVPQGKKKAKPRPSAALAQAAAMPNPRQKIRPAQPGSSVGFEIPGGQFVMAGTFGLLVKDAQGNKYVLSNNHVIANESGMDAAGTTKVGIPAGSPIFQPGFLDGGKLATDQIASLTRWINLRADRTDNLVDGAIAKLKSAGIAVREILFIGAPQGVAPAAVDTVVHKFGRTTSYRAGRVSSVSFDVTIPYDVGSVVFQDQIAIRGLSGKRFSDSGDSGSAILERATNKVVGLLFAGATNGSLTFANHIKDVFTQLKVSLA
ncbi:MAG: hypothetical protein ACKVP0_19060 [Pirellulaceae bacterium]